MIGCWFSCEGLEYNTILDFVLQLLKSSKKRSKPQILFSKKIQNLCRFRGNLSKMHVEADKYNTGALVQKYETGIKGFFKDEDLV